jgi:CBS domain containing-hemolysin-like protein
MRGMDPALRRDDGKDFLPYLSLRFLFLGWCIIKLKFFMLDFLYYSVLILLAYFVGVLLNLDFSASDTSEYELKRRARDGDGFAKKEAWAKKHLDEVKLSVKLAVLFLEAGLIFLISLRFKVWVGLLILVVVFGLMRFLALQSYSKKMMAFWRKQVIVRAQPLVKFFRTLLKPLFKKSLKDVENTKAYYSEEEFVYKFEMDSDVLGESLRTRIGRVLKGSKTKAKDVMLGIGEVPKVDLNLSLTPIVYDELHQKGYDMALVFQGAESNLVGLLHLSGAEAVAQMNSSSAIRVGDKMEQGLQYVKDDVCLDDIIDGFLKGGQNAVLVTGSGGQVVGVITARKLLAWVSGG